MVVHAGRVRNRFRHRPLHYPLQGEMESPDICVGCLLNNLSTIFHTLSNRSMPCPEDGVSCTIGQPRTHLGNVQPCAHRWRRLPIILSKRVSSSTNDPGCLSFSSNHKDGKGWISYAPIASSCRLGRSSRAYFSFALCLIGNNALPFFSSTLTSAQLLSLWPCQRQHDWHQGGIGRVIKQLGSYPALPETRPSAYSMRLLVSRPSPYIAALLPCPCIDWPHAVHGSARYCYK